MLNIRSSTATEANRGFKEAKRRKSEANLTWLRRHLRGGDENALRLLLVGGTGAGDLRLRVAQSHLRHDMTPSHWSHVALLGEVNGGKAEETEIFEIALEPAGGFGFPAPTNGVQTGRLGAYADRKRYPNLALITLPVERAALDEAIGRFQRQRSVLDATELVLLWLAFLWGVGRAGNPLLSGNGIPSAAFVEVVLGAVGYELTPGLESRASCPEAIWQAARWWHEFYSEQEETPLTGVYSTEHYLVD
jgi:hypothetical protein